MSKDAPRQGVLRRIVAVASTGVALVAMTAQPALAAGGFARVERAYTLSGERDHVRIDTRIMDPSPLSGVQLSATLGSGDDQASLMVMLEQGTGTGVTTRELAFEGYGTLKAVSGPGCTFTPMSGGWGRLGCRQAAYDWLTDRHYRMSVVRGNQTTAGWLWKVNMVDLKTGTVTKVVSFRHAFGRLSTQFNGVAMYANIANCAAVDRMAASVRKPVAAGSTVGWQAPHVVRDGCSGTTVRAPVDANGTVTMVIAQ